MCVFRMVPCPRLAYTSALWNSWYRTFLWRLCTSMTFLSQDRFQKSTTATCEQFSHVFSTRAYGWEKRSVFSGRSLADIWVTHRWWRHPPNRRQGHGNQERPCVTECATTSFVLGTNPLLPQFPEQHQQPPDTVAWADSPWQREEVGYDAPEHIWAVESTAVFA